uniref:Uncharacterized protein n=1 Tax=Macrostomum lignano TaxID=282301 RepID=A0A1I8G2I5_9PLAT
MLDSLVTWRHGTAEAEGDVLQYRDSLPLLETTANPHEILADCVGDFLELLAMLTQNSVHRLSQSVFEMFLGNCRSCRSWCRGCRCCTQSWTTSRSLRYRRWCRQLHGAPLLACGGCSAVLRHVLLYGCCCLSPDDSGALLMRGLIDAAFEATGDGSRGRLFELPRARGRVGCRSGASSSGAAGGAADVGADEVADDEAADEAVVGADEAAAAEASCGGGVEIGTSSSSRAFRKSSIFSSSMAGLSFRRSRD